MAYNLFISHSWEYDDQYDRLIKLLDAKPYFEYKNYSVPKNDPIHNVTNDYELKEALKRHIMPASHVLIIAGVYASYSKWIGIEIGLAQSMRKKIIAVEPWGSDRTSTIVKNAANEIVRWNTDSIVNAIRRRY